MVNYWENKFIIIRGERIKESNILVKGYFVLENL